MIYKERLKRLSSLFEKNGLDAFIITDPIDLYYLLGVDLSAGQLMVEKNGETVLLVDGRYFDSCVHNVPGTVLLSNENSLGSTLLKKLPRVKTLGCSGELLSYYQFNDMAKECALAAVGLHPCPNLVMNLRKIKDPQECERLRSAAKLGSNGFDFVTEQLKEGITEKEVAKRLEIFWLEQGGDKLAFEPIVAFGENSAMPHYRAGARKLKKGDVVLIDIGVTLNHYHSDMTRVLFFGEPPTELKSIYYIVLEAQQAALELCRPGTRIGDLDQAARDVIEMGGYGPRFVHSLGHGIGLQVHEAPTLRNKPPSNEQKLEVGMCVTIEPGIYLPGLGGVRIEDTILIQSSGFEDLTQRKKEPYGYSVFA